jgi:hypothetical protein
MTEPLRRFVRRCRVQIPFLLGTAHLLGAALLGRVQRIWIGDSHVAHYTDGRWPCPELRRTAPGEFTWHIGPRLMYSLATQDYPPRVRRVVRVAGWLARLRRRPITSMVFSAGEIDIRCHVAPRVAAGSSGAEFSDDYVAHAVQIARAARAREAVFIVPPPPSDDFGDRYQFPIAGTLDERIEAFRLVRARLRASDGLDATDVAVRIVDATDDLAAPDGSLRSEMTHDGCHVNASGRNVVQARFAAPGE